MNARAVLVDKVPDPKPTDEPRLTFAYHQVHEDLPGVHMELSARVHDSLSDPRHGTLFSADLKHAYYSISLHPEDRHIFAFTIQGIGQLQPTRMPQGAKSSGFTIKEFVHRAFGIINNAYPEPSLLDSNQDDQLPTLTFYIDDFFGGFKDFESQFQFLSNHFFPRIE